MSFRLEHLVLYELVRVPGTTDRDQKIATLNKPFHYSGFYHDLKSLIQSGMTQFMLFYFA